MSYDTMLWNLHGYVESPATDDGPELLPVDAPDAGLGGLRRFSAQLAIAAVAAGVMLLTAAIGGTQ